MTNASMSEERFDIGRVFGMLFKLIGKNFLMFFALALVFSALPYGFFLYVSSTITTAQDPTTGIAAMLGGFVVLLLGPLILQASLLRASVDDLSGRKVSIGRSLGAGLAYFLPLIALAIIMGLGIMLGLILLIVPGIILMIRWSVAAPALVAEGVGMTGAMGRSAELTQGHRWAIFGLYLIFWVVYYVFVIVTSMIMGVILALTMGSGIAAAGPPSLPVIVLQTLVQAVTAIFSSVLGASIYFELRRTKEGIGATEIASVFD